MVKEGIKIMTMDVYPSAPSYNVSTLPLVSCKKLDYKTHFSSSLSGKKRKSLKKLKQNLRIIYLRYYHNWLGYGGSNDKDIHTTIQKEFKGGGGEGGAPRKTEKLLWKGILKCIENWISNFGKSDLVEQSMNQTLTH